MLLLVLVPFLSLVMGVKREDFKRCDQSGFCARSRARLEQQIRGTEKSPGGWRVNEKSVVFLAEAGRISFILQNGPVALKAELGVLEDGRTVRLCVDEAADEDKKGTKRYRLPEGDVISKDLTEASDVWSEQRPDIPGQRSFGSKDGLVLHLAYDPFSLSFIDGEVAILEVNGMNLFHVETSGNTPERNRSSEADDEGGYTSSSSSEDGGVLIGEKWGRHYDTMPRGPQSLSMDLSFPSSPHIYGLPEHTTSLDLLTTCQISGHNATWTNEPYRLYNLDVFEYELGETMALYGAVPFVLGRGVGALWNNPSETWVDIINRERTGRSLLWTSESGIVDLFLIFQPSYAKIVTAYAQITGYPALPPLWSLGYHQCRWNYKTEADLLAVHAGFDEHRIPVDTLWLDIEHTRGKRYFSWDMRAFPDPEEMQRELASKGRHLVNIVDPHMKADEKWDVYQELIQRNFTVLDKNSAAFNGHCWPGDSVWADYLNAEVRDWWAGQFTFDKYKHSSSILHIWNDMNEPSVFSGPEITMPKDALHMQGGEAVEHRNVHNVYGQYMHRSTFEGLRRRDAGQRPFVLSRAFYSGSQKYGAIWTGDNAGTWSHLAASVPMLLGLSMAGIPFVGADVGGFFGDPEPELLLRWYQTGALYPFFRAHAHVDTKRREPWLFDAPFPAYIRDAIRLRYQLLPYLYTLFYEASISGAPVMRPMWYEHAGLETVDDQFMLGSVLMHKPVTEAGLESLAIALPSERNWYDFFTLAPVKPDSFCSRTTYDVSSLDTMALFVAGGSVLPLKLRQRRSSKAMLSDPFTLLVALDSAQLATGTVYIDDGQSYSHELGAQHYMRIAYTTDDTLKCEPIDASLGPKHLPPHISTKLDSIIVTGFIKGLPSGAHVLIKGTFSSENKPVEIESDGDAIVRLRLPPVSLNSPWTIQFEYS